MPFKIIKIYKALKKRLNKYLSILGIQSSPHSQPSYVGPKKNLSPDYLRLIRQKPIPTDQKSLRYNHILIITYGRSGSTLIQGILNAIPGVRVFGENGNVFFDLYKTFKKLSYLKKKFGSKAANKPNRTWYGIGSLQEEGILNSIRGFANDFLCPEKNQAEHIICTGFKEIRYHECEEKLEDYLDFLQVILPNSALIINTRNLSDVLKSGWWKDREPNQTMTDLQNLEARFLRYAANKDNCFHIRYEDVVANNERLEALFRFLGAFYNKDHIQIILNTPHSYNPTQAHIQHLFNK